MNHPVRLAISTCPNDTFAFAGVLLDRVDRRGLKLEITLHDIQELNDLFRRRKLDAGKASFFAALRFADDYGILDVGAALGFGVGPLLLAAPSQRGVPRASSRILVPGADTTAHLLFRCLYPEVTQTIPVRFAEIMPMLREEAANFGVVIHEGRFTYQKAGLRLVADLGATWEQRTQSPLPLGGLLARTSLAPAVHRSLTEVIRDSLAFARANRQEAIVPMRQYAEEFSDDVLWRHVELYVNRFTESLGSAGRCALLSLQQTAAAANLVPGTRKLSFL